MGGVHCPASRGGALEILYTLGGLEVISEIQNIEVVVKLEGCTMNNISRGPARISPGIFLQLGR